MGEHTAGATGPREPAGGATPPAPRQAAITEIVRVSHGQPLTWIVGIDGGKVPLTHWSGEHRGPSFTGWTHVIGVAHPR